MSQAAAYMRYSSEHQDDNTIEAQLRAIEQAARSADHEVTHTYADRAESGRSGERGEFLRMIADIRAGRIRVEWVYVYALSRFMRDSFEASYYRRLLKRYGVRLVSATEPRPEDPKTGDLVEGILDKVNEYESRATGERTLSGSKEVARRGYWTGGPAPFGYRVVRVPNAEGHRRDGDLVVRARLEIEPSEAVWVRRIFELAAATGWGGHRIYAALCAEAGHPVMGRKGRPLGGGGVNAILRNSLYKGDVIYNDYGYEKVSDLESKED